MIFLEEMDWKNFHSLDIDTSNNIYDKHVYDKDVYNKHLYD